MSSTSDRSHEGSAIRLSRRRVGDLLGWRRLLLLAFGLIGPLFCLEASLRVIGPFLPGSYVLGRILVEDPLYGSFHPRSESGAWRQPEFASRLDFSAQGLRGPEIPYAKPEGEFRILVLGDSFCDAIEVPVGNRFTELLQSALDQRVGAGRVRVINAGVVGWSNSQELVYFEQEGVRFQPDLVLLAVYPHNDVVDNVTENEAAERTRGQPYFSMRHGQSLEQLPITPTSISLRTRIDRLARTWLWSQSWLQSAVLEHLRPDVARASELGTVYAVRPDPGVDYAWQVTDAIYARLNDRAAAYGARFQLVHIPSRFQIYEADWRRLLETRNEDPSRWDSQAPGSRLLASARQSGIPLLDLQPLLQDEARTAGERLYFRLDSHWTAAGHRVVARALFDHLMESGLLPAR